MIKYLQLIGMEGIVKGFFVFLIYGIATTIYIHLAHGLESDLPNEVKLTLEGPLSIYTFGWLSLAGLAFLLILSKGGTLPCNIESKRPKRVFWVALPFCEAAIALGIVIGATLLGVAISAQFLSIWSDAANEIYPTFYGLAVFFAFITYPVIYFTLAVLDTSKTIEIQLNIAAAIYVLAVGILMYLGLPLSDVIEIGILSGAVIIFFAIYNKFKRP